MQGLTQQQIYDDFNREGLAVSSRAVPRREEVALLAQEAVGIYEHPAPGGVAREQRRAAYRLRRRISLL